jgi:hypothetical protein
MFSSSSVRAEEALLLQSRRHPDTFARCQGYTLVGRSAAFRSDVLGIGDARRSGP